MKIYLLRHGQVQLQSDPRPQEVIPDPELSSDGIRQAELLGSRLRGRAIQALYSSDLRRAEQTARIVGAAIGLEAVLDPRLREIDLGSILRAGWGAYPEEYAAWRKHAEDLPYPGGENGQQVFRRVEPALTEYLSSARGDIAVVTHGGVIMAALSAYLGMGQEKRFRFAPPENCSISTLVLDAESGQIRVNGVNDFSHLE